MPASWNNYQRHNLSGTLPTLEHGRGMGSLRFVDPAFETGELVGDVTFDTLNNASWTRESRSASPSWSNEARLG